MNDSGNKESTSSVNITSAKRCQQRFFYRDEVSTTVESVPKPLSQAISTPETLEAAQQTHPGPQATLARHDDRFRERHEHHPEPPARRNRPIRFRIAANSFRGTATSAN